MTNSNIVRGELVSALAVTKTAVVDEYRPYDVVTYVDGSAKYFSNGVLQAAPAVEAGSPPLIQGSRYPQAGACC